MKIKPPSRKHRVIAQKKRQATHWWLVQEKPKKVGRLKQLTKSNRKLRRRIGPSEFQKMAAAIENDERQSR